MRKIMLLNSDTWEPDIFYSEDLKADKGISQFFCDLFSFVWEAIMWEYIWYLTSVAKRILQNINTKAQKITVIGN